jgi:alpha-1,2-mannosyltransferase
VLWLAVAAAVAHDLWVLPRRPAGDRLADLEVYVGSVRSLLAGDSLYDFHAANGAPFTYPPFAGLLLLPTAYVPILPLKIGWTAASLVAGGVLVWLCVRRRRSGVGVPVVALGPAGAAPGLPVAALGLACSAPFISNLRFGQVSIFVVLLAMIDCLDLVPPRWRGVALGVAAAVKLTPLVFVPYLWLTGRRRAAVTALGTFAGALLVAAVALPADTWRWARREAWHTDRIGDLAQLGNQSVNGALLRLGLAGGVRVAVLVVICAVALVVAYRRAVGLDLLGGFIVVGAAGIVVSPVSWTHHQFVLYLAAVPLLLAGRWVLAGLVAALMIIPLDLLAAVGLRDCRVVLALAIVLVPALTVRHGSAPTGRPGPTGSAPTSIDAGRRSPIGDPQMGLDRPTSVLWWCPADRYTAI